MSAVPDDGSRLFARSRRRLDAPRRYCAERSGSHAIRRFEDAMEAGERFVAEFRLGDVPATRLIEVMERELGILVLMVDAFQGISGAACRLPELDVVLINRHEVAGRRHFDLGA